MVETGYCPLCRESASVIEEMDYHYTESGLPNVYLSNGILDIECENCDETYEFCSWWWNKLEKYTYDGDFICDDSVIFSCVSDDFFRVKEIKNIVI